jgi:hypothetical protein
MVETKRLTSSFCTLEGRGCPNVFYSLMGQSYGVPQDKSILSVLAETTGTKQYGWLIFLKILDVHFRERS